MKRFSIAAALLAVVCLGVSAQGQGGHIELDNLDEVTFEEGGNVYWNATTPLMFEIRFTVGPDNVLAIGNGFEFGSETGGAFTPIEATEALPQSSLDTIFDLSHGTGAFSADGVGYDTVMFSGSIISGNGIDAGWSGIYGIVETGALEEGHEYCLDSCYYPPVGTWLWTPTGAPAWGGPYCYEAKTCCTLRGDIAFDGEGPNVADLVYLLAFMFTEGPAPRCTGNADIDGDGTGPNISDLIYLTTYMFSGGPPPAPCP